MPDPIVFIDLKENDARARQRLENRRFELERQKEELGGTLPPPLQAELDDIVDLLDNQKIPERDDLSAVVDPMFTAIRDKLGEICPPPVGDHYQGKLPSQYPPPPPISVPVTTSEATYSNIGGPILTEPEKTLAAIYGLMEQDNLTNPKLSRFVPAISIAMGEYTANEALFDAVLNIVIQESLVAIPSSAMSLGTVGPQGQVSMPEYHVRADRWVGVARILRSQGVTVNDPLLALKTRQALAGLDGSGSGDVSSALDIQLPNLEEHADVEIVADNLRAMQALYFSASLEELKVFQVVDKLVELFHIGMLPLGRGKAGDILYNYWKKSVDRLTELERRNLYARAFGFPGGDAGQGMPNREFDNLWLRFISAVSNFVRQIYVDDLLRSNVPVAVSQEQVRKSGRDLAANLSLHGYGVAFFAAAELQKQLNEIITLLSDDEVKTAYGARDMWQVVDQVAAMELGGARNSIRYRTMANAGAIIVRWLEKKANVLAGASLVDVIDLRQVRNPISRPEGVRPTEDPTDYDLFNACEQWLAVNGIPDQEVEQYSQPTESPLITSRPIQIPAMARDMLEGVGIQAGTGNGGYNNRNMETHHERKAYV